MIKTLEKAIIIDGHALIYRTFFSFSKNLIEEKDEITAFNNMKSIVNRIKFQCENLLNRDKYKYAIVTFDSSRKTFRQEKLPNYKANRDPIPPLLSQFIPDIQDVLKNIGFVVLQSPEGYEGDDVISTLADKFSKNNIKTDIFSTDKDLLQLVSYLTTVRLLKKGISQIVDYNYENFSKLYYELIPSQIPILKAIAGDSSDNYKGLPGIGEKTALELIKKHKTIDGIYKNIDKYPEKVKKSFLENKDQLNIFLEISTTVKNIDISDDLKNYERKIAF